MAGRAGLADLTRRHRLEVLDMAVAVCLHVRFARTEATLAGVLRGGRAQVLRAPVRRLVIALLILVALEALLFTHVLAGIRVRRIGWRGRRAFRSRRSGFVRRDRIVLSCRRMRPRDDDNAEPHQHGSDERGAWTGGSPFEATHVSSPLRLRDRAPTQTDWRM